MHYENADAGMPMETAKIRVMPDGAAVYYRVWRAERPRGLVVLLHGMASNLTRWSEFLEHTSLKNDWDILRLDLRGHGESLTRGKIGMKVWSEDLAAILDAEGCERAVLIGHSLGAHLALKFAARFPTRTHALVLIDPVFPQALRGRMRIARLFRPLFYLAANLVRALNALGLRRRDFPRRDLRILDEQVRMELLQAGNGRAFVQRYSSPTADMKFIPVSHYVQEIGEMLQPLPPLARIDTPLLVLLSRGLTYTDPGTTAQLLRTAPAAEYETIDAYHWPLTEQPDQVRATIERWFARRLAAGA